MIIGLIRKETKKEFLGINIPFDNFQRHCKFGYYSVCISIVWLAICRNIPNFLWVGLIRNNIWTVINFETKSHNTTVEPACKVSVLSNENRPYKRVDLISGLLISIRVLWLGPVKNWPYKRVDLTSVDHISGLDCIWGRLREHKGQDYSKI